MSKPNHIIGLTGLAGSGKDTVADLLVTHAGFRKMAFSDPLYAEVSNAYRIDQQQLRARETKEHPLTALALSHCLDEAFTARMLLLQETADHTGFLNAPRSPRQILQWWGTDYRRRNDARYWLSQASSRISFLLNNRIESRIVVTDVRFDNEADLIRNTHGGQLWQVKRPGIDAPATNHVSETTGDAFAPDAALNNSHDIKHLQQVVLGAFWAHDAGLAGVSVEITQ